MTDPHISPHDTHPKHIDPRLDIPTSAQRPATLWQHDNIGTGGNIGTGAAGDTCPPPRTLARETPIALSYNGTTHAVMMATPANLIDFAYGFSLTEGLARPQDITRIEIVPVGGEGGAGIDVQIWLNTEAEAHLLARRRKMMGPIGCGLCGIDSIEQALRPLPALPLPSDQTARHNATALLAAMQRLRDWQPLHDRTHAAHCAAFYLADDIITAREDVGRHNALDKLAGALMTSTDQIPKDALSNGVILLTCRVSIDMVQKAVALGVGTVLAVSAPTATAVDMADRLGLTLVADTCENVGFSVYTHPLRIFQE